MAYCSKCGAPLEPNAQFCASCGAPVNAAQSSSPPPSQPPTWNMPPPSPPPTYTSSTTTSMKRPTGVTILAVLAIIGGLALLGFAAVAGAMVGTLFSGLGAVIAVVFVIFALIEFAIAYGFWVGASWAWWLGLIGAVLDIISIISFNVFGLVIGIIMLYYLTRSHVKMWFHKS